MTRPCRCGPDLPLGSGFAYTSVAAKNLPMDGCGRVRVCPCVPSFYRTLEIANGCERSRIPGHGMSWAKGSREYGLAALCAVFTEGPVHGQRMWGAPALICLVCTLSALYISPFWPLCRRFCSR